MNFRNYLEQTDRTLFIARGVPGTGKSTTVRSLAPASQIFGSDAFFGSDADYEANFSRDLLPKAHQWNVARTEKAMQQGLTPLVADNTNVKAEHIKPYVCLAVRYGYRVELREPSSPIWSKIRPLLADRNDNQPQLAQFAAELSRKNLHGVPPDIILGMLNAWEEIDIEHLAQSCQKSA